MIQKAGGILIRTRDNQTELYLIHRPRYNDWSLPKGHIEPGEKPEEAAVREVQEETGFTCRVLHPLPTYQYTLPSGDQSEVWMFEMEATGTEAQKDEEADRGEWMTLDQALERISYPSLREYIQQVYQ